VKCGVLAGEGPRRMTKHEVAEDDGASSNKEPATIVLGVRLPLHNLFNFIFCQIHNLPHSSHKPSTISKLYLEIVLFT